MNEQKQIEEMRKEIENGFREADCRQPYTNEPYPYFETQKTAIAKALYDAGYRKVPDGAVVLTPEERDDEMKATNEILAERDDLIARVGVLGREVEELKAENRQLKTECALLDDYADKENRQLKTECALLDDELRIARQNTIDVLNKLKEKSYVNNYCREVLEVEKIDEMIKELVK